MDHSQSAAVYEHKRLETTIHIATKQLEQARELNEDNKSAIISAKKEMRENTAHTITDLWSSDAFEALAAMNQYANPITDKIADYEAVEQKIRVLEKMIESPYFARIDFRFDGEDTPEEIYIGRASLMADSTSDIYVYDWRSPIASVFYRFVTGDAWYDAPGGRMEGKLSLKRQYEIGKGKLEYFFDADVQIVDEFLRKLLSQNTSSKMKAIIETIQKEQDIVIRDMDHDLMIVQGVAGSGKTSIALHRTAYLMYQGLSSKLSAENILIISPNTLFEQYISNVLPELGEENIASEVFEHIAEAVLKEETIQSRNQFLEKLIIESKYRNVIKSAIEFKTSRQFQQIMERFIEELPHKWIVFEDVYCKDRCIITKRTLKNKILSGMGHAPIGRRLRLLEEYILEQLYDGDGKRIKRSEEVEIKETIRNFTEVHVKELYRKLFYDKDYFYHLAEGLELPGDIEDILLFTQENLYSEFLYYDDAAALTYFSLRVNGTKEYKNIKQVVIDEAQDYYPLHFEIFNLLFPKSKFTILGDINQTLEKSEDLHLYEQIKEIFNKSNAAIVTLDKSFRCTNEILQYGARFLDQNLEIKSFNRNGELPQVFPAADQRELAEHICAEVRESLDRGYQSIGLICKTRKNAAALYKILKAKMEIQIISDDSTTDLKGVFIIPVYMSKGLEFDSVLICDADSEQYQSEDDKKLLYIACTRALHRLNLFGKGEISRLV